MGCSNQKKEETKPQGGLNMADDKKKKASSKEYEIKIKNIIFNGLQ